MVSRKTKKQKFVLYLGFNIEEPNHPYIKEILYNRLSEIQSKYPETVPEITSIKTYIKESIITELWSFPKTFHVTTLFRGKKCFDLNKLLYKEFEENKDVKLEIIGLIYIPKKIVTLIVLTNQAVDNKFPHITGLIAEYKPKHSNDVCCALFDSNKCYENVYREKKEGKAIELIDSFNQHILDIDVTGYINIFEPKQLNAKMKGFPN